MSGDEGRATTGGVAKPGILLTAAHGLNANGTAVHCG